MVRPLKSRRLGCAPAASYFKPVAIPLCALDEVVLALDELEALRGVDLEGLLQAEVAERMGVSRQTVGNLLARAHRKVADALLNGKALRLGAPECAIRAGSAVAAAAPAGAGKPDDAGPER